MSQTILIVDDLEINRVVARTIFEEKYNILEAASGEECIELAKKHPHDIDLILLNLVMPGISGMDILQLRKEGKIFPNTPVIVLTASEDVPTQIHAFNLGAIDYITIPFIREITVYRVANALYFSEQLMELERQKDRFRLKSEKDLMTGLFNKVTTEERIENALAVRTGGPCSCSTSTISRTSTIPLATPTVTRSSVRSPTSSSASSAAETASDASAVTNLLPTWMTSMTVTPSVTKPMPLQQT